MHHIVAESPGPLSAHFPKQIKIHFDSLTLDEVEEDAENEPEKDEDVEDTENTETSGVEDIEDASPEKDGDIEDAEVDDVDEDAENTEPEKSEDIEEIEITETDDTVDEDKENTEPEKEDIPEEQDDVASVEDDMVSVEDDAESLDDVHPSEPPPSLEEEVRYYEDARTVVDSFSEMRKSNGVYVVPFSTIAIQTPVVILKDPLTRSATLKVPGKFANFVKKIEESILEATKSHKKSWFKEELDDKTIEEGFKSFLDGDILKVKVDEDLASFDEHENLVENDFEVPTGLRCILEASEISFGRSEFGVVFSLTQAQIVKPPKCKISKPRKTAEIPYFE